MCRHRDGSVKAALGWRVFNVQASRVERIAAILWATALGRQ
jgi:hypothetical protein